MEGKAKSAQNRYNTLRLLSIVVGAIVPVLIGLEVNRWITATLGIVVASSAAIEGFLRYGERWRHYRNTVELLKSEGWQFFQRIGPYQNDLSNTEAGKAFAAQVETIIRVDVERYITEVTREQGKEEMPAPSEASSPQSTTPLDTK